tara:strand:+ start:4535 stop:5020 length:486 start_codon:yes stop_codon:yes gene_type:complete
MTIDKRIIDEREKYLDREKDYEKDKKDSYRFVIEQKKFIKEIVGKYKFAVELYTLNDTHYIKVRDTTGGRGAEITLSKRIGEKYLTVRVDEGKYYFFSSEFDPSDKMQALGKIENRAILKKGLEEMIVEVRAQNPQPKIQKYMVVLIAAVILFFLLLAKST